MTLNRTSNSQLLSFFTDAMRFGQLDLEPPFQRKAGVWTKDYKLFFIDSILRNYPCPSILLNVSTTADGTSVYEVVDGKQRLSTIMSFVNDDFQTSTEHSDDLGAPQFFSELSPDARKAFFAYQMTVETVTNGSLDELRQAFDRLNRNVARLNAQELRRARFFGRFIQVMEDLADDGFWADVSISTASRVRRMLDVQFVSEIFILTMHGIQDADTSIDQMYADYDEEIPNEREHRSLYNSCKFAIRRLEEAMDVPLKTTRYSNLADFYSLWAGVLEIVRNRKRIDYPASARRLKTFAAAVDSGSGSSGADRYLVAARQGSNKASNRLLRRDLLLNKLVQVR